MPDVVSLNVYDLKGRTIARREDKLEEGMHRFSFSAGAETTYILNVTSSKQVEKRIMLQMGTTGSTLSELSYMGSSADNVTKTAPKSSYFSFTPGDDLRFTGYVTDIAGNMDYGVIDDAPEASTEYLFDIANNPPDQPSEISGEIDVPEYATGLVYEVDETAGLSYLWSVPEDWEITDGHGSHAITVNAGSEGGEISVKAENNCGLSQASVLSVNVFIPVYELTLDSDPPDAGNVSGEGIYQEGEEVTIMAAANQGWEFVEWTGDTDYVDNILSANTTVIMPSENISLTANFQLVYPIYGDGVIDIDGNEYMTVIIGNQEWMAENLRVSRYNNEDSIPTGLNDDEWVNIIYGAYAIYPHDMIDGLDSDVEVVSAYGKLYNWYSVADDRGLCPAGWNVPSDDDWTQLINYVASIGFPNEWNNPNGAGNALKSCRQIDSPFDGCNTSVHPRWQSQDMIFGFDTFAFSALPGGCRGDEFGTFYDIGVYAEWWSITEDNSSNTWCRSMHGNSNTVSRTSYNKGFGFSVRCVRDITEEPTLYNLQLQVSPDNSGSVTGAGEYEEGAEVSIDAIANEGWEFVEWTGDTEVLDNPDSSEVSFMMPAQNISLTANFQVVYPIYGDGVIDIDGNEYLTVIIGNQEWMAENLRVTKYNNGDTISTGLSDTEWQNTTDGAYTIYPYTGGDWPDEPVEGINSDEEMVAAYGKLYNWFAVDDSRGLCPVDWNVPSDDDWTQLVNYLMEQFDYHNDPQSSELNGAGNALKSCRQVDSSLGGECDTSDHPRWNTHGIHKGLDAFGFSALPAGLRWFEVGFFDVGIIGGWWSSAEGSSDYTWGRNMYTSSGSVARAFTNKRVGFSVRCMKVTAAEPTLYNLQLQVSPDNSGSVTGAGEYEEGAQVSITASAISGWEFVEWTGDTDYIDNTSSPNTTVTMPSENISLTANFQVVYPIYGDGVIDIDGNEYITVIIGNQEWMAENLRVTKYNNGDFIPTGLSDGEWSNTTNGAYAIYPHEGGATEDDVIGINSDEEMVAAYGQLYNWFAVDDERGLCPVGWEVPNDDDWTQLIDYLVYHGFPNSNVTNGAGNALKSCRQVDSPQGGDCDSSDHPRWNSDTYYYGFDEFGFLALPGGYRGINGWFHDIGYSGMWWSSNESSSKDFWYRFMGSAYGTVYRLNINEMRIGFNIRCVRKIDE